MLFGQRITKVLLSAIFFFGLFPYTEDRWIVFVNKILLFWLFLYWAVWVQWVPGLTLFHVIIAYLLLCLYTEFLNSFYDTSCETYLNCCSRYAKFLVSPDSGVLYRLIPIRLVKSALAGPEKIVPAIDIYFYFLFYTFNFNVWWILQSILHSRFLIR